MEGKTPKIIATSVRNSHIPTRLPSPPTALQISARKQTLAKQAQVEYGINSIAELCEWIATNRKIKSNVDFENIGTKYHLKIKLQNLLAPIIGIVVNVQRKMNTSRSGGLTFSARLII
jgi:hypothetical protein